MPNRNFGNDIHYKLIRSRRKSLTLIVSSEEGLVVRAPLSLPESEIRRFIRHKENWIRKKIREVVERRPQPKIYENGTPILYLGKGYPLCYTDKNDGEKISISDKLYVSDTWSERIRELLKAWYIYQGNQIIPRRVKELSETHGFRPKTIKVTKAERRWGSCSSKGGLCFSWRLMMAPPEVIDYVIIHELVHLKIRDHSRRFWDLVTSIDTDYKRKRKWLRDHEPDLRI